MDVFWEDAGNAVSFCRLSVVAEADHKVGLKDTRCYINVSKICAVEIPTLLPSTIDQTDHSSPLKQANPRQTLPAPGPRASAPICQRPHPADRRRRPPHDPVPRARRDPGARGRRSAEPPSPDRHFERLPPAGFADMGGGQAAKSIADTAQFEGCYGKSGTECSNAEDEVQLDV